MGYVEILDGSHYLARVENDKVTIELTKDRCAICHCRQ